MKKETIKNFNTVLLNIEEYSEFSPGVILSKLLNNRKETQNEIIEFNSLVKNVFIIGINEDFFIKNGDYPWCSLTKKGKLAKKKGGYFEYEKYIEQKELESKDFKVNYGNIIQGDNYGNQSSGNTALNSPTKQKTVNNIEKAPSKKSFIEILSWIIGSIVGLIAIYEFVIKKL